MENASKALLMAAGVLIALVIIGAFMLMMSSLADYQDKSYQSKADAQTTEFNNQYVGYIRDNIRGSDMVSLMNKVLDYNSRKLDDGYKEIKTEITISGDIRKKLAYDEKNRLIMQNSYTQNEIELIVGSPSSGGTIRDIEKKYQQKYANQIATEIFTIESLKDNKGYTKDGEQEFVDSKILPVNNISELRSEYGGLDQIYEDALVYYEYVQFKRAVFNCTDSEYDANTGRIISMDFECTGIGV